MSDDPVKQAAEATVAAAVARCPQRTDHHERSLVALEVLTSERSYVDMLNACEELYFYPSKKLLSPEVHASVFSFLQSVRDLNRKFLNDLEAKWKAWTDSSTLGDLFIEFAPFFKMYISYVNNHERIGPLLQQLKRDKKYAAWQEFEQTRCKHARAGGNKLASFLITPIQRVPRYKLLLVSLLRQTGPDHPDHALLPRALGLVEQIAISINEAVRASENRAAVMQIQAKFGNEVTFVAPHRVFLMSGTLLKKVGKEEDRAFKFFLFNDVLVWATHRDRGEKYRITNSLPIDEKFFFERVPSSIQKHSIKVIYDQESFYVQAACKADRDTWMAALAKCIEDRSKTIAGQVSRRRRSSFVMAPVYKPKNSGVQCAVCAVPFSVFRPKHNCKCCGEVVCGACSPGRLAVVAQRRSVRVCKPCVEKVAREEAMISAASADAPADGSVSAPAPASPVTNATAAPMRQQRSAPDLLVSGGAAADETGAGADMVPRHPLDDEVTRTIMQREHEERERRRVMKKTKKKTKSDRHLRQASSGSVISVSSEDGGGGDANADTDVTAAQQEAPARDPHKAAPSPKPVVLPDSHPVSQQLRKLGLGVVTSVPVLPLLRVTPSFAEDLAAMVGGDGEDVGGGGDGDGDDGTRCSSDQAFTTSSSESDGPESESESGSAAVGAAAASPSAAAGGGGGGVRRRGRSRRAASAERWAGAAVPRSRSRSPALADQLDPHDRNLLFWMGDDEDEEEGEGLAAAKAGQASPRKRASGGKKSGGLYAFLPPDIRRLLEAKPPDPQASSSPTERRESDEPGGGAPPPMYRF